MSKTPAESGVDPLAVRKSLTQLDLRLREWFADWDAARRPLADALRAFDDPTAQGVDVRTPEYAPRWLAVGRAIREGGVGYLPRLRLAECRTRTPSGEYPDDGPLAEYLVWHLLALATAGDEAGVLAALADARRHLGERDPAHFSAYTFGERVRDVWRDVTGAWEAHHRPGYVSRLTEEAGRLGLTRRQVADAAFPDWGGRERQAFGVWLDGWEGDEPRAGPGPPAVPPPSPQPAQSHLPAVRCLLNACDVTAAALHRFNERAFLLHNADDAEAWRARVFEVELREWVGVRDVLDTETPSAERHVGSAGLWIARLGQDAEAALVAADRPADVPAVRGAVRWLANVHLWHPFWVDPLPTNIRHALIGVGPDTVGSPPGEGGHEYQQRRYDRQRALVAEYRSDHRQHLLRLWYAAGVTVPAALRARERWFTMPHLRANVQPITNDELCGWLATEESPEGVPAEPTAGGVALVVTHCRVPTPADGPPPSPDELRPHLLPDQRATLERLRHTGHHLRELLAVAADGCPPPTGWRPTDDADVRGCLTAVGICRDLVSRCDRYDAEAATAFRIDAPDWVCSRLPGVFLDDDPRFDIARGAAHLRARAGEYTDWLTVAARTRGILAAGQPLEAAAERQLGYSVGYGWTASADPQESGEPAGQGPPPPEPPRPSWDANARTLTFGGWEHRYRRRARSQEQVLAAFQQAGWPERVTTGLPDYLSETVRNMNGTLGGNSPVRFEMDGTGEGVRWCQRTSSVEVS